MMGLPLLPDELLLTLTEQWACREAQIQQLSALVSPTLPTPPTTVIYGPRATGKSGLVEAYLKAYKFKHTIISCRECITGRHLLERTVSAVTQSLRGQDADGGQATAEDARCENLSTLVAHLQRLLGKEKEKFVLVFDGVDKQREAQPTLLPALARLNEFVPNLTTLLILRHPSPHLLHRPGIPHILFQPYTRAQSIHLLSLRAPDIFLSPPPAELQYDAETHEEDKAWLWPRFCAAVWDSLGANAARDLVAFRTVCGKLWRSFVQPIVKGEFGTRDFSRLMVAQRRLFQDEDMLLVEGIVPAASSAIAGAGGGTGIQTIRPRRHDLPYYAKWLLVAAYLASYNPAKLDALYFMKSTERKRKRKKGGGTSRAGGGRASQNRKIARHLLAPAAFPLDRLLSILHAILPHDFRSTVDVYTQVATLSSLRLLVRSGGIGSGDPLEAGGKWRVGAAVSWEYVQALGRSLKFDLVDYVAE